MNKTRNLILVFITVCLLGVNFITVQADGIIIPEPPVHVDPGIQPMRQLEILYHHVSVEIIDQIAMVHVDQVFYNPNSWEVEGQYVFPIPDNAVVDEFILWIDGEPVQGEILDAEKARRIYEDIVRDMQDPALLEYADQNALQVSIYPIPPGGERRIELQYAQVLTVEDGLVRFDYPLNTEKFSLEPLDQVRISVEIDGSIDIRAVYSPSHALDIERFGKAHLKASYEENQVLPDQDFTLLYSIGEGEALHVLSYRDPDSPLDDDGYFMMLLAPPIEDTGEEIAKDVLLVLDRSGSMEGEKFRQAREAIHYILDHLNEDDQFYLAAFSSSFDDFAKELQPASQAKAAGDWLDRLSALGSTDINRALLETAAVADPERPTYLIFLTDGLPTEGETNPDRIIANFGLDVGNNVRFFPFGVGYDVDTYLLDSLSSSQHGRSTYVIPGEDLGEKLSGFYEKISTPVLTNLEIDFGGMKVFDIFPVNFPDLFKGSQVVITGRYRNGGKADIRLVGEVNGQEAFFEYRDQLFVRNSYKENQSLDQIPRLWATRKIGYLLEKVRLYGPDDETIEQIVFLSIRYGIVTEYTSYLVTEPDSLGGKAQDEVVDNIVEEMETAPEAPAFGRDAVEKAAGEGEMYEAETVPDFERAETSSDEAVIRQVGSKSFLYNKGVWMDTQFDPDRMKTSKIAFLSDKYFELSTQHPDIAAALALGKQVILVVEGKAFEIVDSDQKEDELPDFEREEDKQSNDDEPVIKIGDEKNDRSGKTKLNNSAIFIFSGLGIAAIICVIMIAIIGFRNQIR